MPTLISADERNRLQQQSLLTTKRMLRELPEALTAIAASAPLIILLEDLHWSDPSTIDLLRAIAVRTDART